ncbi:unnamed protein product [Phytomonas sp. Hart1]|nr:unnamed protein product [Phytomonas sp. Hart1]|eukprot:CCW70054.1 unnamed protein product [Phytomonas sp. isolate Hart1]
MIMHSSVFLNESNNEDPCNAVIYSVIPYEKNKSLLITGPDAPSTPMSTTISVSSPSMTKMPPIELPSNNILSSNRLGSNHDEALMEIHSVQSSRIVKSTPYSTIKTTKSQESPCISKQVDVEIDNESDFDDFTLASSNTAHVMTFQSLSALQAETQVSGDSCSSTAVDPMGDVVSFVSFRRPNYRCCRVCHSNLPSAANFCPQCGSTVEPQSERSGFNTEVESSFSSALVSPSLGRDPCCSFTATPLTPSRDVDFVSEHSMYHRRVYLRQVLVLYRHENGMLGCGTNGAVYKAIDIVSGQPLAVKEMYIDLQNKSEIIAIRNELRHLSHLRHPKVIEYYGCSIQRTTPKSSILTPKYPLDTTGLPKNSSETIRVYILMERMECGSLQELLKDLPDGFPERTVRVYAAQLLEAIHYVHQCDISHCDIKPSNLLLASDGTIKLADFGCAKMKAAHHPNSQSSDRELAGTPVYMPPETLLNLKMENVDWVSLGQAQDIWAIGCVVYQLLTGKTPWVFTKISSPFALLSYIQTHPEFPLSDELSPCALDFCRLCLELNPCTRVKNMDKILASPFVSNAIEPSQW